MLIDVPEKYRPEAQQPYGRFKDQMDDLYGAVDRAQDAFIKGCLNTGEGVTGWVQSDGEFKRPTCH